MVKGAGQWTFLLAIIIALIALTANNFLIQQISIPEVRAAIYGDDIEIIDEIEGDEGYTKQNPYPLNDVEHFITTGALYQPSEVVCEISNKIFDDFQYKGYTGSRAQPRDVNCFKEKCIIKVGAFELIDVDSLSPSSAQMNTWNNTLSSNNYCYLCSESGTLVPIDEVCLNYDFTDKMVGGTAFCDRDPGFVPLQEGGTTYIKFGNSECGLPYTGQSSVTWNSHCGDPDRLGLISIFCYNEDSNGNKIDMVWWLVDNNDDNPNTYGDQYAVKDRLQDQTNDWALNINPHKYMYGILWDFINKKYDVVFERIPKVNQNNVQRGDDLSFFDSIFDDYIRYNPLGNWYVEARTVKKIIFIPDSDIDWSGANSLIDKLEEIGANKRPDIKFGCNDDCSISEPIIAEQCPGSGQDVEDVLSRNEITLHTNLGENSEMEAGKTYIITFKNWYSKLRKQQFLSTQICLDKFDRSIGVYRSECPDPFCDITENEVNCPSDCSPGGGGDPGGSPGGGILIDDDFSGPSLAPEWNWYNDPLDYSLTARSDWLQIRTRTNRNFWGNADSGHFLYQTVSGDFTIETRVSATPTQNYQQSGLMVRQDSNNWNAVKFEYSNGLTVKTSVEEGNSPRTQQTTNLPGGTTQLWLRINRNGNSFTSYFSTDGSSWNQQTSWTQTLTDPVRIGIVTHDGSSGTNFVSTFDYFTLTGNNGGGGGGGDDETGCEQLGGECYTGSLCVEEGRTAYYTADCAIGGSQVRCCVPCVWNC